MGPTNSALAPISKSIREYPAVEVVEYPDPSKKSERCTEKGNLASFLISVGLDAIF